MKQGHQDQSQRCRGKKNRDTCHPLNSHLALRSSSQDPVSPFCASGMSKTACPETHTAAIHMEAQYGLTRKHTASHCGAAIHAASRMPVHKITMTRERQWTALFCTGILTHHNTHTHSIHPSQV